ncbi:GNAT family N-acetyltransferase, partial [Moellerella wisconsensis]|uniref:GNAT family N-acetyltransferase n=1 Tax=Moellerella wisconsensis TaxID=158849 RepID=UPI0006412EDA
MNKSSYEIKYFDFKNESDISRALKLLTQVFKKNFTREWWDWKYNLNPFGQSIGYYSEDKNSGQMSSLRLFWRRPCFKIMDDSDIYQAGDTATHPDYQKKGLAKILVSKFLSEHTNAKIYNFPNDISKKIYLSNGWKEIDKFFFKVIPFSLFRRVNNLENISINIDGNFKKFT